VDNNNIKCIIYFIKINKIKPWSIYDPQYKYKFGLWHASWKSRACLLLCIQYIIIYMQCRVYRDTNTMKLLFCIPTWSFWKSSENNCWLFSYNRMVISPLINVEKFELKNIHLPWKMLLEFRTHCLAYTHTHHTQYTLNTII